MQFQLQNAQLSKIKKHFIPYVNMTKEKKTFQPLTPELICRIYTLLHSEGMVAFPQTPASFAKVDATVANINGSDFGVARYSTTPEKIVAHLYFLIKNHPFTDGNKRTATIVFLTLCAMNNYKLVLPEGVALDSFVVALEQFPVDSHQHFIKTLAENILKEI